MTFEVPGDAYDRFMGRYSRPLAARFSDWLGVHDGQQVLDVGCGPGAWTEVLVDRLGADHVRAVDPSEPFVASCRERLPEVDVRLAGVEALPFEDGEFDLTGASLVVHFMPDPVAGLREMARVTKPDGLVGVTVWEIGGRTPMRAVREAIVRLAPARVPASGPDADQEVGSAAGIERALEGAGLREVEVEALPVTVTHPSFEEWWTPYLHGVGPIGEVVASLDPGERDAVETHLREQLGEGPFDITAVAYGARGRV